MISSQTFYPHFRLESLFYNVRDDQEIFIPRGAEYIGKTIRDSGLREKDINVLTLYRGTAVIPTPLSSRQLEPDDRLLCFGKLELIRDLIPAKINKKRRYLTGEETFAELKKINPDVKVLISSGYSKTDIIKNLIQQGAKGSIPKPYSIRSFSEKIEF